MTAKAHHILLSIAVMLLLSCSGKKADQQQNEIGDKGGILATERAGDFSEDYEKAAEMVSENRYHEAKIVYEELLEKESEKDLAYAGLGACFNFEGEYERAISYYQKSLAINPGCLSSLIGMGSAYYSMARYDSAIFFYTKSKDLDFQNASAYWGLALVYDEMGDIKKAKENARLFIKLVPTSKYRKDVESILSK